MVDTYLSPSTPIVNSAAVGDTNPMPIKSVVPVGGGITWGAPTAVAMTGSSKTFVAANASRKALIYWNPSANAGAAYDLSGAAVTLAGGIPLAAGATPSVLTGSECPVGIITAIGTSTQNLYYVEGT